MEALWNYLHTTCTRMSMYYNYIQVHSTLAASSDTCLIFNKLAGIAEFHTEINQNFARM